MPRWKGVGPQGLEGRHEPVMYGKPQEEQNSMRNDVLASVQSESRSSAVASLSAVRGNHSLTISRSSGGPGSLCTCSMDTGGLAELALPY